MTKVHDEFPLPEPFVKRLNEQLADSSSLIAALDEQSRTSIRLHPLKKGIASVLPQGETVFWNSNGRYLQERPKYVHDPNYHAGLYYPMEASSMFLSHVLDQIELPEEALLLDLCAAPGGKTLMLKDAFPEQLLVSNEIDAKRVHVLKENAIRWGTNNHVVIQSDALKLQGADITFDLILVDAPCSGEGLFRKDKKSRTEWTAEKASGCATRQEGILDNVVPLLAEGGYLIYSTCTFNPEENMRQVQQLVNEGLKVIEVPVQANWDIEKLEEGDAIGYQFWPHRVRGEGFFISVLRKEGEAESHGFHSSKIRSEAFPFLAEIDSEGLIIQKWEHRYVASSEREMGLVKALSKCGNIVKKGLLLGELKGKDFIPSHDLSAQIGALNFANKVELTLEQSLDYLRGNALSLACNHGAVLLTFNNLGIGMGKSNGTRINNLLPKHLRVF